MIIEVPATSANLGPGFDTLGVALNLTNRVVIKPSRFFSVSIRGEGSRNRKLKSNNIFVNIFNEYYINLTNRRDNFKFTFFNQIPISRGLGSSSAVIVSAVIAAYEMANVSISKKRVLSTALNFESHPDNITPAVMGGFNTAVVEKNQVISLKKEMPSYLKAVVVIPDRPISTAQSRTTLPKFYSKNSAIFNLSKSSLLTAAFFNESWELLRVASKDKFHQKYRMNALPELFEVQKIAIENGALMSTLSGSGSTFFNMVYENDAKRMAKKLKDKFPQFNIKILDFNNSGARVIYD